MDTDKLKPGEVLGSALEIYGAQVWTLIPAAFVLFAVVAAARIAFTGAAAVLVSLIALVATTFYQGMVVALVGDIQDGRRDSSVGALFAGVAPIVLPLIGLSILFAVAVTIGLVLLIVPGLYMLTVWAVAAPALVIERDGVFAAFARSRELVRGNGWQVFAVILLLFVLGVLVGVAVGAIAAGLGNGGAAVVTWAANVIVSPFTALVSAILYFSLRRLHGEAIAPATPSEPAPPSI